MLNVDAKSLRDDGDRLFAAKRSYDTRNQEIADLFYVERADFTVTRDIGTQYADHLMTGYPAMVRRDLGNSIGSMLRPKGQPWFHVRADREEYEGHEEKAWLEYATKVQRRAMYDRVSNFTRATKEGDHDFATFGGAAITTEVNRRDSALLYRCWHLRDVAFGEDSYGILDRHHRNWKPTIHELKRHFGDKCHNKVLSAEDESATVDVRHVVVDGENHQGVTNLPWVNLYIDCDNEHVIVQDGSWTKIYSVPRWATVSGSPYPYSPASVIALPDARLLQSMTLTLLEAGEKAVNPPLIGVAEAIRGDMQMYAGGFTAVDQEYDERLGEVLRPLTVDKSGLPFGIEMSDRTAALIREAFYLNTLSMPPAGGAEMTAFEVGQRVQEYIRNALPLFEPMEDDYNANLCEITFETLMRNGAFGSPDTIPEGLRGADTKFDFEGPLSEALERDKGQKFLESKAMIAEAAAIDPASVEIMDFGHTLRDVLGGIGAPTEWLRSPEEVTARAQADKEAMESAQLLQGLQQGADVAETLGRAAQSFEGRG